MMQPQAPMMDAEDVQDGGKDEAAEGKAPQSGAEVGQKLLAIQQALSSLAEGASQGSGLPPEAIDAIQAATTDYNKFLSVVGKQLGIPVPDAGPAQKGGMNPAEAGGNPNAVSADMPMSRGRAVKAVPAM